MRRSLQCTARPDAPPAQQPAGAALHAANVAVSGRNGAEAQLRVHGDGVQRGVARPRGALLQQRLLILHTGGAARHVVFRPLIHAAMVVRQLPIAVGALHPHKGEVANGRTVTLRLPCAQIAAVPPSFPPPTPHPTH